MAGCSQENGRRGRPGVQRRAVGRSDAHGKAGRSSESGRLDECSLRSGVRESSSVLRESGPLV